MAHTLTDHTTWTTEGPGPSALLALSGVATAISLLLFAAVVRRLPLTTISLLQFIPPSCSCCAGARAARDDERRALGGVLVWLALVALTIDSLAPGARTRRGRRTATRTAAEAAEIGPQAPST